jgi:hypothetical protein
MKDAIKQYKRRKRRATQRFAERWKGIRISLNEIDSALCANARHIPCKIEPDAKQLQCWGNVAKKVKRDGGKAVSGWLVVDKGNYYSLIAHDNWEDQDGSLWDITPQDNAHPFFADPSAGKRNPSAYTAKEGEMQDSYEAIMREVAIDIELIESQVGPAKIGPFFKRGFAA